MKKTLLIMALTLALMLQLTASQLSFTKSDVLKFRTTYLSATNSYSEYELCNPTATAISLSYSNVTPTIDLVSGSINSFDILVNVSTISQRSVWVSNVSCNTQPTVDTGNGTGSITQCVDNGFQTTVNDTVYGWAPLQPLSLESGQCANIRYKADYSVPYRSDLRIDHIPRISMAGQVFDYPEYAWFNVSYNSRCSVNITNPDSFQHLSEVIRINVASTCSYLPYTSSLRIVKDSNVTEIPFQFENETNNSLFIIYTLAASSTDNLYLYFNQSGLTTANTTFLKYFGFENNNTEGWTGVLNSTINAFRGSKSLRNTSAGTPLIYNPKPKSATDTDTEPFLSVTFAYLGNGSSASYIDIENNPTMDTVRILHNWGSAECGAGYQFSVINQSCPTTANLTHGINNTWKIATYNATSDSSTYVFLGFNGTTYHNITAKPHTNLTIINFAGSGQANQYIDEVYIGRILMNQYIQQAQYSSGPIESESSLGTEQMGRAAIDSGIFSSIIGANYSSFSDRQLVVRYSNGTQTAGRFDRYVTHGDQRYAINFISGNDTYVNAKNITPVFYTLEMDSSLSQDSIIQAVMILVNNTAS